MNRTLTKIVAVILAVILAASVCVAAVYALTSNGLAPDAAQAIVMTGDNNMKKVLIVVAGVAAVGLGSSLIIPKFRKK